MKIKKGDSFVCVKKITTVEGEKTFKKGIIYTSFWDGCLTYKDRRITIIKSHLKHFVKIK